MLHLRSASLNVNLTPTKNIHRIMFAQYLCLLWCQVGTKNSPPQVYRLLTWHPYTSPETILDLQIISIINLQIKRIRDIIPPNMIQLNVLILPPEEDAKNS